MGATYHGLDCSHAVFDDVPIAVGECIEFDGHYIKAGCTDNQGHVSMYMTPGCTGWPQDPTQIHDDIVFSVANCGKPPCSYFLQNMDSGSGWFKPDPEVCGTKGGVWVPVPLNACIEDGDESFMYTQCTQADGVKASVWYGSACSGNPQETIDQTEMDMDQRCVKCGPAVETAAFD